jgi:uncharacterized caspase-like protein
VTGSAGTTLLCGLLLLLTAVAAQADKRVALVLGNSAYQNAPALATPAKDAQAIAAMFKKVGFDAVIARYDAGNLQFKHAIREFDDAAAGSDMAVVYYAGHAIEIQGVNYLIPVDAKLASDWDTEDELIPLERLVEPITLAGRLGLVILDASRDNPFAQRMKRQRPDTSQASTPGSGPVEPVSAHTLLAYAAKAGSLAVDEGGENSPFTAALLHNLFVPGLDIRLAFGRVRDEVLKKTGNRQEPFVYGALGGGIVALVPAPAPGEKSDAASDSDADQHDYDLIEKIGTKTAWEVFLGQHPTGHYADLARGHIDALDRAQKARDEQAQ